MQPPKAILIIRFSSLGDLILLSCLFRELKKIYPNTKLDLLTSAEFADVHQANPHLSHIFAFPRKTSSTIPWLSQNLANLHYDYIYDAHGSLRSYLSCFWLKYHHGFGHRPEIRRIHKHFWNRWRLLKWKKNPLHTVSAREKYLALLPTPASNKATEIFLTKDVEQASLNQIFSKFDKTRPLLALAPGAAYPLKCWPKEHYWQLIELLQNKVFFLLLGGSKETNWGTLAHPAILNGVKKLSLLEAAAWLKQAQLLISNDSALMHLAESQGTPVIALFGPTVREFGFAPFLPHSKILEIDLPCRPCSLHGQGPCVWPQKQACLRRISPEQVASLVCQYLQLPAAR